MKTFSDSIRFKKSIEED